MMIQPPITFQRFLLAAVLILYSNNNDNFPCRFGHSFTTTTPSTTTRIRISITGSSTQRRNEYRVLLSSSSSSTWNGEVTSNSQDGRIRGCIIQPAPNGVVVSGTQDALDRILSSSNTADTLSNTEWMIQIDGIEADLGRFSLAIYKKLLNDAKQQQFQGYRKGTIPPPLLKTYIAYTMDECARETILEAMEQNQIRPFETCRNDMILYNFTIPPPPLSTTVSSKNNSKNKKNKKPKASKSNDETTTAIEASAKEEEEGVAAINEVPISSTWTTYATMKEAIDIGKWQPGQSFSFCAKQVRGQKSSSLGRTSS
jgi:hypothetical protein